jgi:hypothetical protein
MFWILAIIAVLLAFSVGVGSTKYFWKKSAARIEKSHQAELETLWHETFRCGWNAASNDYGHLYERLKRLNKEYDEFKRKN